ncbi:MAG: DUF2569 family protein [Ignavibacteriae bacterium]|nr:DUF2569 family protein [Ignavibacteriota bacterium]
MEENSEYYCSDCGNPVKESDTKCSNCGAELNDEEVEKLSGFEGWLLVPLLWLIVGPIVSIISLVTFIRQIPLALEFGFGIEFGLEIFIQIILLILMLYAGFYFFQKRKNAPRIVIFWLKVSILLSFILLVVELLTGANGLAIENGKQFSKDIISAIIWIPYFRKSKRVKATFTK